MSLAQITGLSLVEIIGDTGVKLFANNGGIVNLGIGILGYIGVFIMLIVSLQGSQLMMVNVAWDGLNGLITTIYSFFVLGERFEDGSQYFGIILILLGVYLLKVPLFKPNPFIWPSL